MHVDHLLCPLLLCSDIGSWATINKSSSPRAARCPPSPPSSKLVLHLSRVEELLFVHISRLLSPPIAPPTPATRTGNRSSAFGTKVTDAATDLRPAVGDQHAFCDLTASATLQQDNISRRWKELERALAPQLSSPKLLKPLSPRQARVGRGIPQPI